MTYSPAPTLVTDSETVTRWPILSCPGQVSVNGASFFVPTVCMRLQGGRGEKTHNQYPVFLRAYASESPVNWGALWRRGGDERPEKEKQHTHTHRHTQIYTHIHRNTETHTHTAPIHTNTHMSTHRNTPHTHARAHTHTHTHTHTHSFCSLGNAPRTCRGWAQHSEALGLGQTRHTPQARVAGYPMGYRIAVTQSEARTFAVRSLSSRQVLPLGLSAALSRKPVPH